MELKITNPPVLRGDEKEQLQQIRSYLVQMQRELMYAIDTIQPDEIVAQAVQQVQGGAELPDGGKATIHEAYRALKALIIKTAGVVEYRYDEIIRKLESDYLAASEFGVFTESLGQTITETAAGVLQEFQYDSQLSSLQDIINNTNLALTDLSNANTTLNEAISALDEYNIHSDQYIRSGLLYFDDQNVPRYGVAVGENLTTIEYNGELIVEREGLAATFTSDRLSFWQGGVEVAYVSNKLLYINEARILDKLYLGNWVIDTNYGFTLRWAGG